MSRAVLLLALFVAAWPAVAAPRLRLASWNLEWLMTPATFDSLAGHCLGARRARDGERAMPCDLVPRGRWSEADFARLADFAASAAPDVVALQEVDGPQAAALVFPAHGFCFTRRRQLQNVGFAIRRGIPYRCNADHRALAPRGSGVRYGADVTLYPGTAQELRLLAVHLKSGCPGGRLTAAREACGVLLRQVPALEDWIDRRAREQARFAVVGDFNRHLAREGTTARDATGRTVALWPEINDGEPPGALLANAGAEQRRAGCATRHDGRPAVDHIVLGRELAPALVTGSFRAWPWPGPGRWPDHCLISIELELESYHGL